jgi:LysR family glycine cleavage system transcriptional activator
VAGPDGVRKEYSASVTSAITRAMTSVKLCNIGGLLSGRRGVRPALVEMGDSRFDRQSGILAIRKRSFHMSGARPLPSLAALRAFEAAARTRSFSAAGREMNVSHAAVGQHVRRLEADLGRRLMVREGRGVALTRDGAALAQGLTEGFGAIRAALDAFAEEDAERPLRVTATPNFAASFLMPRMGGFRRAHPDIALMLDPTPEVVEMGPEGPDLAVRYGRGDWPGLVSEPLLPSPLVVAASPDLLKGRTVERPEDLLALPWLIELGTDEAAAWLAEHGVVGELAQAATHLPGYMMAAALRQGQGVGCLAAAFVEEDVAAGRLVILFGDEDADGRRGYHLVRRPGVPRPPARAFARWLRREAKAARDEAAPPSAQ